MTHAKAIFISNISGFDQGADELRAQKRAAIAGDVSVTKEAARDRRFIENGVSPETQYENKEKDRMGSK